MVRGYSIEISNVTFFFQCIYEKVMELINFFFNSYFIIQNFIVLLQHNSHGGISSAG